MNKQLILYILSFTLLLLTACRKDSDIIIDTPNNPIPGVEIQAAIQGVVTDRQGNAMEDVLVSMGGVNTQTDENGVFLISDRIQGQRALLNFSKAGYFDLQKAVFASKTGLARLFVELTERNNAASIQSSSGGQVTIQGGGKATFAPNSFVDEQGNAYSGTVSVFSRFIDPTDENIDRFMPGDLTATDADNEVVSLQSFGMVEVQLEGTSGQKLQINQAATLEFPVPAALLSQAPSKIPLWYYDEATGLWKEEGEATLQGDTYIGQVNHFSLWNCDLPAEVIFLEGTLVDEGNNPVIASIRIRRPSTGEARFGYTSQAGYYGGLVPANEVLLMEVLDDCGVAVYTANIGPFADNTDMGTTVVTIPTGWTSFTARLVDCNQEASVGLYLIVNVLGGNSHSFFPDSMGIVSGYIATCQATDIIFTAYDLITREGGTAVTLAGASVIDAGTLVACGVPLTEIILLEFDGGGSYTIPLQSKFTAASFNTVPSLGTIILQSAFAVDQIGPNAKITYAGEFEYAFITATSWPEVRPSFKLSAIDATADNLINYRVENATDGILSFNGTNPGDTLRITWENVLIEEYLDNITLIQEHANSKVTVTSILE